jgi:hypothetical protein
MSRRPRTPPAIRDRLARESGFALPTVTLMLLAAMAIAGVAVSASIGGQAGVVRDQGTKTALGIAEAGAEQALLLYNRYGLVEEGEDPCAPLERTLEPDGWCGTRQATVNGSQVSYRVRPESTTMEPSGDTAWIEVEVVSTATLDGVTRRVDVTANSSAGQDFFHKSTVKSKDGITLESFAEIHAGAATNGDLVVDANAKQCGTATVGIGRELKGEGGYYSDTDCTSAAGEPEEDEIELPPVEQGQVTTENDNGNLFTKDRVSGNKHTACFDGHDGYNKPDESCGERELVIGSNSSVSLTGRVYSLCKLTLDSNSALYSAPGAEVRIYFDAPEACGYGEDPQPVRQLDLRSNSQIAPASGDAADLALFFVGSKNVETEILLNSNTAVKDAVCQQNFIIYAPYTDVQFDSESSFCGGVAAQSIHLSSNAEISNISGIVNYPLPLVAPHYEPSRFVDCRAEAVSGAPDEGC